MIGIALEIATDCGKCGATFGVNALTPKAVCPSCGTALEIPPEAWREALAEPLNDAPELPSGKRATDFTDVGEQQLEVEYGRDHPCDPATGQPLDAAWLIKSAAKGFVESSPGAPRLSVRLPPAEYAPLLPGVVCLVGEVLDPPPPARPAAAAPLPFHCSSCGETLLTDGTAGEVECPKCRAETEVPEALWAKFHPDFPPTRWFLLYDQKSEFAVDAAGKVFAWDEVTDLLIDEDDNLYLAGSTDGRDDAAIASFRPDLTVRWVQHEIGLPYDESEHQPRLALAADNRLLVHCYGRKKLTFLSRADGSIVDQIAVKGPTSARVAPAKWKSVVQDADGTLLAYYGDDENQDERRWPVGLVRCSLDGAERPIWPSSSKGWLSRLQQLGRAMIGIPAVAFVDVGDRPARFFDPDIYLALGRDGSYVMYGYNRLARFARDGLKVYFRSLPDNIALARVHVDETGAAYAVYGDAVMRVSPDGEQVETSLQRGAGPAAVGEETLLARGGDGALYLFGADGRARVIGPDGGARFVSRVSRRDDAEFAARRSYVKRDDDEPGEAPTAEEQELFAEKYEK